MGEAGYRQTWAEFERPPFDIDIGGTRLSQDPWPLLSYKHLQKLATRTHTIEQTISKWQHHFPLAATYLFGTIRGDPL